ncbi:MAG: hypothetical protein ABIP51_01715 [Bacteroidia bacterium]
MKVKALVSLKTEKAGGRKHNVTKTYRPSFVVNNKNSDCVFEDCNSIEPGKSGLVTILILSPKLLISRDFSIEKDLMFDIAEGKKIIGCGVIMEIIN